MPLLKKELVHFMASYLDDFHQAYVIQTSGKTHPLCSIYHKSALPFVKEQLENKEYRMMDLLAKLEVKFISLGVCRT